MINGNNQYWQNAAMNIRKDGDEWRLAKDTVSNTYTPEDEGKVVSNGELVAQTAMPDEITDNGTIDTTLYDSVTVNVSGGGGASGSDVIFYDYDGTIVQTYSAADFANLSAMPANPTHEGLTAQGWNWTLADAKTYVATYGKLNIGQMYITSDGKTRLYYIAPKNSLTIELPLILDSNTKLDIDWGDNSEHTIWTSEDGDDSKSHTYSVGGRYIVAITVVSGEFTLNGGSLTVEKIELGSGITTIHHINGLLSSITIPNSVTALEDSAFDGAYRLSSITIPNSVTTIGDNVFEECNSLIALNIPNSVTTIGEDMFYHCVSNILITIPDSVTTGYWRFDNSGVAPWGIPNNVTTLVDYAFAGCSHLKAITIPNSVTTIGNKVFSNCGLLTSITFKSNIPPALSGDLGIMNYCIIRVPQGTLSDYTSASNYPDPSSYIYEEY